MPTWDDRFPFLSSSGKAQLRARYEACHPQVAEALGLSEEQLRGARPLGCGNFGCTFLIDGLPKEKAVLKVTSDNLEAHVVQLLTEWGEAKPPGIVHYEGIWQLGECSVLPKMRPFKYKRPMTREEAARFQRQPGNLFVDERALRVDTTYRGPGAPYRPAWLVQREELPDVNSRFKGRLKSRPDVSAGTGMPSGLDSLESFLALLMSWAQDRAIDWGLPGARRFRASVVDDDRIRRAADAFSGNALVDALDWLMERGIGYFDFQKIANLGWRQGTGLVIRDIGFASTEMGTEADPQMLNEF